MWCNASGVRWGVRPGWLWGFVANRWVLRFVRCIVRGARRLGPVDGRTIGGLVGRCVGAVRFVLGGAVVRGAVMICRPLRRITLVVPDIRPLVRHAFLPRLGVRTVVRVAAGRFGPVAVLIGRVGRAVVAAGGIGVGGSVSGGGLGTVLPTRRMIGDGRLVGGILPLGRGAVMWTRILGSGRIDGPGLLGRRA